MRSPYRKRFSPRLGSCLEVGGRDAAPAQLMHQDKQNVRPRILIAFVVETLSAVIQYYRKIGNIWDTLYTKHQLRDSDITLDRVYVMLSEFLSEVKLNQKQAKNTQIVTGASNTQRKPTAHDEYINASKGKIKKAKVKVQKGKGVRRTGDSHALTTGDQMDAVSATIAACKYLPRRQPGKCAICRSTKHYAWETEEYESKGKKGKGKRSKSKGKSKGKGTPRPVTSRPSQIRLPSLRDLSPSPNLKPAHVCLMDSCSL